MASNTNNSNSVLIYGVKLENRLNIQDLQQLKSAFMKTGDGYNDRLSLDKEEFCKLLKNVLTKGTYEEHCDLFDKIDVTKERKVDWDKIASHLLLEYVEKDDRVKATQVPQWKNIKSLQSPHKDVIQKVAFLRNTSRYIVISKEGTISTWDNQLHRQKTIKIHNESVKPRDMWVTNFIVLQNINKIALAFTSKEIAFYDLSSKLEFNCQYKVVGLEHTPLSMDYWSDPENANQATMVLGDTGGFVYAFLFQSVNIALFDRPHQPAGESQEQTIMVDFRKLQKGKFKNCRLVKHNGHKDWTRQVKYASHLECFISCATTYQNALVLGWIEKAKQKMKLTTFNITQGVNSFDYHSVINLIGTAGVDHQVCLWNPYVISKPVGVLRGHMAPVLHVQFNASRMQLISFSKDKVLRVWDVQLQVCLQRLAGMFPKGPEMATSMFFHDERNRLFITFNYQLTLLEMKPEVKDRVLSHEKPVTCAIYNTTYNQVVSACQGSTVIVWMLDTGQKAKQFLNCHGNSEITTLAFDQSETRFMTGSTDGTVKIWDFNGHCHNMLNAGMGGPVDIYQIVTLKRSTLILGWDRYITVFRNQQLNQFHVEPSDWKGGQEHQDDILCASFQPPSTLATASYDGEIVIWNTNSEVASRHLRDRFLKKSMRSREKTRLTLKSEPTFLSISKAATQTSMRGKNTPSLLANKDDVMRPITRALSSSSEDSVDEQNDYIITRVAFLEARKNSSAAGGANLVSCGGNGWVRFWNTSKNRLIAEFVAHQHVGLLVMAASKDNHFLVTGDSDGNIKVWNIQEYCLRESDNIITQPPPMSASWQPHVDMINHITLCERNDRLLIITASLDCSVQLWDIYGNQIGVFGQEDHWKIEQYIPVNEEAEKEDEEPMRTNEDEKEQLPQLSEDNHDFSDEVAMEVDADNLPEEYFEPLTKVSTWGKTRLGKGYQEIRSRKRERKQPGTIPDLPYLTSDKTGQPPAGPYGALVVNQLDTVGTLKRPDFVVHPHRYFRSTEDEGKQDTKLPSIADELKTAFDERSFFPKYILEYEAKMKSHHRNDPEVALNLQKKDLPRRKSRVWNSNNNFSTSVANIQKPATKSGRLTPITEKQKQSSRLNESMS
ncbi:cilia- and flagella-associated protein 337-like isoform X2 [Antedon mediterranea]|uniref:cilia- and flagella-associated protein 337-like isoform X2 n=1 Tax=Antedon mediterranea TaxID=105859 RepID=UPI003AF7CBC6